MKKSEITAVLSAFALSATIIFPPTENVFAENITSVYEDFNANDVNGKITVEIPEKTSAKININFTSPEVTDEPYYITETDGGNSFSFDIEGRDTTDDDYRNYTLIVEITGSESNNSAIYTDTFTVPDGNDNPDSFMNMTYSFTVDYESAGSVWDISSETETQKNIVIHINNYLKGDVNGDEFVDAVDATQIQQYYAELSASGTATWITPENQTTTSAPPLSTTTTTSASSTKKSTTVTTVTSSTSKITTVLTSSSAKSTTSTTKTSATTSTTTTTSATTTTSTTTATSTTNIDYSYYMDSAELMNGSMSDMLYHHYYIYDINDDGIYEFITKTGNGEADSTYSVYSIEDNQMTFWGDIPAGNSVLTEKDGKIYKNLCHTGYQSVDLISFDGKSVSTENVYEKEQSETYIDYGTNLKYYDAGDTALLSKLSYTYYNTDNAGSDFSFNLNQISYGGTVSVDSGSLNLRTAPNLNCKIILEMPKDSFISIYGNNDEWYYVSYEENSITYYGYASRQYITKSVDN